MIFLFADRNASMLQQCKETYMPSKCAGEAPFPGCQRRWQPQHLPLQAAPAVTGPNPRAAGMTGEWCRSLWSVTGSSGRISRAPLSCLPSILPLPIIVNQSGVVSTGGAVQQGSVVRRARLPAPPPARGTQGAPLRRLPGQDATTKKWNLFSLQHIVHMAGKHRGVKPLEQLCVDKRSSWGPRCKHSFTALSAGKLLSQMWPPC